jgi:RNA polymerase sigma-70 factor (ECF subfamily)
MNDGREMRQERESRWRQWMVAAQDGDSAAYEKLLGELLPHVRGFVRRQIFDVSALEDVVQNVFLSMHRARHTYRPERAFSPWLHAIARNAAIDHVRARGRRVRREISLDEDGVAEPRAREAPAGEPGLSPELEQALAALPVAQREAVLMIHVEELSVIDAARRAGVSPGALKVRAHRGYRALRARLEASEEWKGG